jgi:RNA polymerase sigma-70 factor (ECF subfamily)
MELPEFRKSVYPLRDKLYRFARRILEHREEAEDTVQEVFIRLWNNREKLDEYRSVEALAMVTTKNLCLDRVRSRKYPFENFEDHRNFLENIPGEQAPDHSELIGKIRKIMEGLPETQRIIMHLRDIEGYEFSQIAEVVEMNENAIRVALSRARKRTRDLLVNSEIYEDQRN